MTTGVVDRARRKTDRACSEARLEIEASARAHYRELLSNDPEAVAERFVPGAVMSLNGSGVVRPRDSDSPTALRVRSPDGSDALLRAFQRIFDKWRLHDIEVLSLLVDGHTAAALLLVDLECRPTGMRAQLEVCDTLEFRGDRIASMIAFLDTAQTRRMRRAC